jgi:hypothetical protein
MKLIRKCKSQEGTVLGRQRINEDVIWSVYKLIFMMGRENKLLLLLLILYKFLQQFG